MAATDREASFIERYEKNAPRCSDIGRGDQPVNALSRRDDPAPASGFRADSVPANSAVRRSGAARILGEHDCEV